MTSPLYADCAERTERVDRSERVIGSVMPQVFGGNVTEI